MKPFLEVSKLHAWYGESHVLHGVDLTVGEGEVVGLLGRNGAGRTSTLRSILGLVSRREGSIKVAGRETIAMAPHRIPRLGIGYCPEERGIFASLSAEENLELPPIIAEGGMSVAEIYRIFPNLEERRTSPGTKPQASTGAADSAATQPKCPARVSAAPPGTATIVGTAMASP